MIVLDSSAPIAILQAEPEGGRIAERMAGAHRLLMSAVQLHESAIVLHRRSGAAAVQALFRFVEANGVAVVPFDRAAALDAIAAYALAARFGAPLLFKGEDFARTDVAAAMPPA
jgi:ribonuclease VapC